MTLEWQQQLSVTALNFLKNYKMSFYKVHRITSFAQCFNIMSRQFSVATGLLWQHVSLNMTQNNSSVAIGHREFPKIDRFPFFLLLFTFSFFLLFFISSYEPYIKTKKNVIVVKSGGFYFCILKWRKVLRNKIIFYVTGWRKSTKTSCRGIERSKKK